MGRPGSALSGASRFDDERLEHRRQPLVQCAGDLGRHLVLDRDVRAEALAVLWTQEFRPGPGEFAPQRRAHSPSTRIATPRPRSSGAVAMSGNGARQAVAAMSVERRGSCSPGKRWNSVR